jgi:hypothetical protein
MNKYVEYNLINNIPIVYAKNNDMKYIFCPRYTIATEDYVLQCFESNKQRVSHFGTDLKYIKIEINKNFKTLNNDVIALYCYLVTDCVSNYDVDFKNFDNLLMWLKNDVNNHYILITTPILKHGNQFYSIANDNKLQIIHFEPWEMRCDKIIINKLIQKNGFTICDNYNIIISLYQKSFINKVEFLELTTLLNTLKNFYYTSAIWMQIMNHHRLLNACDFPIFYLLRKPLMLDNSIIQLYDCSICNNNVYLQTHYQKDVLITRFLSSTYPCLTVETLKLFIGENMTSKLWLTYQNVPDFIYESNDTMVNDYYGLFASFVCNKSMWNLWCKSKQDLLNRLLLCYNHNILYFLSDVLTPLFMLYENGYEDMKIKKWRVHMIWYDVLSCIKSQSDLHKFLQNAISLNLRIPYVFLLDIHTQFDINWGQKQNILYKNIYKCTSLNSIIYNRYNEENINDSFYCFYKNIIEKRIIFIIMCIYKRFNMQIQTNDYMKGFLLINFLKTHIEYLI